MRSLSGLHLLGVNPRAFMVHPVIMERDHEFRAQSYESEAAFADLPAVVTAKMHEDFIVACGGTLKAVNTKDASGARKKRDTYEKTLELVLEEKPNALMALERKMTVGTIMSHLEKLVEAGRLNYEQVLVLLEPALIADLPEIMHLFEELDTMNLTPVFEHANGTYSYDELRLARLALAAKRAVDEA